MSKSKGTIFGNILIITSWTFKDALVQIYTLPYLNVIRDILPLSNRIILVTAEQPNLSLTPGEIQDINTEWEEKNIRLIAHPYYSMGIRKMLAFTNELWQLYRLIKKENISTIHCFCTPSGSIGYFLSKLTGARLIIDSYEPHAESMVENGTWTKKSFAFRFLFLLERLQSKRAYCFIGTSQGMKDYAKKKYGVAPKHFYVKPACVNLTKFLTGNKKSALTLELGIQDKIVCVYAGKLGGIYLRQEVFEFVAECYAYWGDKFRFLMLTNAQRSEVLQGMEKVGLPEHIVIQKFVKHEEVPQYLSLGDFALNPVKPVPTKRFCTSLKDAEYWATGLPVVITKDISDDSAVIRENNIGYELQSLTLHEYQNAIAEIDKLINQDIDSTRQKIRSIAEKYRGFQIAERVYKQIYS